MRCITVLLFVLLISCKEDPVDVNKPGMTVAHYNALHNPERLLPEHQQYVELEGYYTGEFEESNFSLLHDGKLLDNRMWTEFDSLIDFTQHDLPQTRTIKRGIYMRVGGIRKWGKCYGHMSHSESKLRVTKIFEVDTTRTRFEHIMNELRSNGYYVNGLDTCYLPPLLKLGKLYKFRGEGTLKNKEKVQYELSASTADGAVLEYHLAPVKEQNKENTFTGKLNLDLYCFLHINRVNKDITNYYNQDFLDYYVNFDFRKPESGDPLILYVNIRDESLLFYAGMKEVR